MALAEGKAFS
jgi:hypothetical protein